MSTISMVSTTMKIFKYKNFIVKDICSLAVKFRIKLSFVKFLLFTIVQWWKLNSRDNGGDIFIFLPPEHNSFHTQKIWDLVLSNFLKVQPPQELYINLPQNWRISSRKKMPEFSSRNTTGNKRVSYSWDALSWRVFI